MMHFDLINVLRAERVYSDIEFDRFNGDLVETLKEDIKREFSRMLDSLGIHTSEDRYVDEPVFQNMNFSRGRRKLVGTVKIYNVFVR
jgi:hypothetical protein